MPKKPQLETCARFDNMECYNAHNIIALPVCVGESNCACFNDIFLPKLNDSTKYSVLEYTDSNLREVAKYLTELSKHINKDHLLKDNFYTQVPAYEVKQANDHFQDAVSKLKTYQIINDNENRFNFFYFGKRVACNQLADLFEKIGETQDMSLRFLNTPKTLLPINTLFEVLHLHQIVLYILQQFYHMIVYKKPMFLDSSPFLNISGFNFRKN